MIKIKNMKKTFRKINFLIISFFIMGIVSCSKEVSNAPTFTDETKNGSCGFTMEGVSANDRDVYILLDVDSSIFEWRSYMNGCFLFDKEIIWEMDNPVYQISNVHDDSFDVEYQNGDFVHVFNVVSEGTHTTFNIYNELGELVNLSIDFDTTINFIEQVSGLGQTLGAKIPWPLIYGGVLLAVQIIDTYNAIQCERIIKQGVEECTSHPHCRAKKHTCSVECYSSVEGCTCNCGQYTVHG